ncbi:HlyD family type I secretion periplasmic adaptor subunit [Cupriavidus necator]|uniref:HlyD family type I secretion periplasmic adaptor subunit n=1 Tax=Cupriavidus necator TaxID=106590 RepID=UPI0009947564|nr:HlyD family type I secretion periplasmic adaptor subunit [Cupriavidus necator]
MSQIGKSSAPAVEVLGGELTPQLNTDESRFVRVGWLIAGVGVIGTLLWAAFAPLDKGVPVQGTVVVEGYRKEVQHPTGGIVDEILVHDGDHVKAGQVLVRMNAVQARSQAAIARAQYLTALAVKARLVAEASGAAEVHFPPELQSVTGPHKDQVEADMKLQRDLFQSRRQVLNAALGANRETIAGLRSELNGLGDLRKHRVAEQQTLSEQLKGMSELAEEGYVPRSKMQDLQRERERLAGDLATQAGRTGQIERQIAESNMNLMQRRDEYLKEVRTQLTDVQRDVDTLSSRLAALDFDLANTEVRAPVEGAVVGIRVFTRNGVIPAGAKLMDVVPTNEPLEAEGQVPVNLIDKVRLGLPVEMAFTAFNQNHTPRIPATVSFVSADRLVDEKNGTPYYRVRTRVSQQGMTILRGHEVRPGMPVEIFVRTGERSMLSYLFKPLVDRTRMALTEE